MKTKFFYISLTVLTLSFLALTAFNNSSGLSYSDSNEGVIKFSHSLHSEMVDCESCHNSVLGAETLSGITFPNHDNCADCHDVDDDCSTCHIDDNFEALRKSESALIFNHKFHIENSGMSCQDCHQGFEEVDYSWQAENPHPEMADCYSCHNETSVATNACEACHTSTVNLVPQSHKSANFITAHKFSAERMDANCVMCHNNNSCEECHVGTTMITEGNTADDFYQPYYPSNFTDGVEQQAINRVHSLDYRFSHGIDARGKTVECQTCHNIDTFCSSCHQADNSDFALSGVLPMSHLEPNFFTIGVGTGGGEHAILAKRDIESCASCHDTNGADPTCITCHLDTDGIEGTNPKTHPSNFMRDENGDWHSSQGSICYNCHTSASPNSPAGIGFCGYCHGAVN